MSSHSCNSARAKAMATGKQVLWIYSYHVHCMQCNAGSVCVVTGSKKGKAEAETRATHALPVYVISKAALNIII